MARRRLLAASALAVAVAIALAGCSVLTVGAIGVKVVDGDVIAIVTMCDGYTSKELQLTRPGGDSIFVTRPTWRYEETEKDELNLGTIDEFTEMLGDQEKQLINIVGGNEYGGRVLLTAKTLTALEAGDVLSSDPGDRGTGEPYLVTQEQFDDEVSMRCGDG